MSPTAYLASLAALTLSLLAGCGGNVVVDKSSLNEGGSGAGGGSGGTGTTGTTTTTVTNTNDYCGNVCAAANQYDCVGGNVAQCVSDCIDIFAQSPSCAAEIKALYDCAVQSLPQYGCGGVEQACQTELVDLDNCTGDTPSPCGGATTCTADTYSCSCEGDCNGSLLQVVCKGEPGTTVDCQCLIDGNYKGSCQDNNLSCNLYGCCAQYFPL